MKTNTDLNDFSGGPHWLSGHGKVDRVRIRRKHRDAHYALLGERDVKPVKPETRARLEGAIAQSLAKHIALHVPRTLKIMGHSLATWARGIHAQDTARIATAISTGLTAGDSNTDIAHRVIGSRRNNGVDGVTEITRQHILRLGHGLLKKRKTRMSGHSSDV
jgi:hypothetical protein